MFLMLFSDSTFRAISAFWSFSVAAACSYLPWREMFTRFCE